LAIFIPAQIEDRAGMMGFVVTPPSAQYRR